MADRDYDWIARRAYALWEEEGRPHGRDDAHWQVAVKDYEILYRSARETVENAERRIAEAQVSAEREDLSIPDMPDATTRQPRRRS
ncbi:DUF2934 domain-containing protein [Rhizobium sp. AAP43]|uniref:DUF2934 domain-containing protein n=1 Tax=Rhizobium sp. AAP43 TaxID=1523420 RepID=UPI0006B8E743|nr:DUF2934 domain-containing protein [Rhizobium sp. AAP43]KPF42080.1 hypothetical protein IP76_18425 [Rhizobium sp. AAP43]